MVCRVVVALSVLSCLPGPARAQDPAPAAAPAPGSARAPAAQVPFQMWFGMTAAEAAEWLGSLRVRVSRQQGKNYLEFRPKKFLGMKFRKASCAFVNDKLSTLVLGIRSYRKLSRAQSALQKLEKKLSATLGVQPNKKDVQGGNISWEAGGVTYALDANKAKTIELSLSLTPTAAYQMPPEEKRWTPTAAKKALFEKGGTWKTGSSVAGCGEPALELVASGKASITCQVAGKRAGRKKTYPAKWAVRGGMVAIALSRSFLGRKHEYRLGFCTVGGVEHRCLTGTGKKLKTLVWHDVPKGRADAEGAGTERGSAAQGGTEPVEAGPGSQPPASGGCVRPRHTDPSAGGKYSGLLRKLRVPQDCKKVSAFRDVGYLTLRTYLKFKNLPAGYWVYHYPNWYIWKKPKQNAQGGNAGP